MVQALESIRTSGGNLEIVNQLLLPHRIEYLEINSVEDAFDAIKSMKVRPRFLTFDILLSPSFIRISSTSSQIRGAPAIASLAALSFAQYLTKALEQSPRPAYLTSTTEDLKAHVVPILSYLYESRPTAVNLGNAIKRLNKTLKEAVEKAGGDVTQVAQALIKEAKSVADEDVGRNKDMSKHGGEWLVERVKSKGESGEGLNVLTVCNTGSLATSVSSLSALTFLDPI